MASVSARLSCERKVAAASADSLEAQVLANSTDDIRYVDSKQLKAFGAVTARPIDYSESKKASWENVVDGLIVLRQEHPPEYVRSAAPQSDK